MCEAWKAGEGDWNLAKIAEMDEEEICNCAPSSGKNFFYSEIEKKEKIETIKTADCFGWGIWENPTMHYATWKPQFPECNLDNQPEDPCKDKIWEKGWK